MSDGLQELYRVSQAVLSVTRQMTVRDVLQVIVRSARSLVGARYAALGVPDEGDSFAEFVVDGISEAEQRAIGPLPRRHGMLAALLSGGKPERLADITADPRFEWWPAAHPRMSHFLGVPVRDGDQVLGIIFAANKVTPKSSGFTERDQEILSLFAAHAAIAITNARLFEQSRELSVLQERSRLARELHDAVAQKLFSIRAHARAAGVLAARDDSLADGRVAAELEIVAELGAQAHAELRAVIDGLAPPDLEALGLAEAVRRYATLAGRAYGVLVTVSAADDLPPLGPRVDAAVYRVAQEALHNALRHSGASRVGVTLAGASAGAGAGRRVRLEVADDGRGFAPDAVSARMGPAGLGLASMRERAAAVAGVLAIESAPGSGSGAGAVVRLTVPVPATVRAGRTGGRA